MNTKYIIQKQREIIHYFNTTATAEKRERFLKLILEAVWLDGKCEGIKEVREIIK